MMGKDVLGRGGKTPAERQAYREPACGVRVPLFFNKWPLSLLRVSAPAATMPPVFRQIGPLIAGKGWRAGEAEDEAEDEAV
jgi:hypothetical protein